MIAKHAQVATPSPPEPVRHETPRGVPVSFVRWERPLQIPGKAADDAVKSETTTNGRTWVVEYVAPIRHFRITYVDVHRPGPPEVGYVHESRALNWRP